MADSLKFDNTAWVKTIKKAEIEDFRFHNLLQPGRLKIAQYGGSSSNATENLAFAASRIETENDRKVIPLSLSATLKKLTRVLRHLTLRVKWLTNSDKSGN